MKSNDNIPRDEMYLATGIANAVLRAHADTTHAAGHRVAAYLSDQPLLIGARFGEWREAFSEPGAAYDGATSADEHIGSALAEKYPEAYAAGAALAEIVEELEGGAP